ncbi:MAG: hypothetical protein WCJ58_04205 [bacterium]
MSNVFKSLDALFISKVRIKALKYFVLNPEVPIHLRGAVREFDEEINAVRRELSRLEEIGFLTSEPRGNKKYFALNSRHIFLDELTSIIHKSFGLGGAIVKNASKIGEVKFAVLTENYIRNLAQANKVDLIVVGEVNLDSLAAIVAEVEKNLNREVHYAVLKAAEFLLRKKRRDVFIMDFLMSNKTFLIGHSEDMN